MGICDEVSFSESDELTPQSRAVVVGPLEGRVELRTHRDFGCTLHKEDPEVPPA